MPARWAIVLIALTMRSVSRASTMSAGARAVALAGAGLAPVPAGGCKRCSAMDTWVARSGG